MSSRRYTISGLLVLLSLPLLLVACGGSATRAQEQAVVAHVPGTDTYRIRLSAEAARRIDVRTAAVARSGSETVIPYSAVLYSSTGQAWAYVNPRSLTFVRRPIVVDHIDRDRVILSTGPAAGTRVATVGVQELRGIEAGAGVTP